MISKESSGSYTTELTSLITLLKKVGWGEDMEKEYRPYRKVWQELQPSLARVGRLEELVARVAKDLSSLEEQV